MIKLTRRFKNNKKKTIKRGGALEEEKDNVVKRQGIIDNATSNIASNVNNVVDKIGAAIIGNINDTLGSEHAKQTTLEAVKDTANIVKNTSKIFNDALNDPKLKAEIEDAIINAGKLSEVVIKASEKPLNEAVDVAVKSAQKASSAGLTGAIKVGTDALGAVPFVGAIINAGKALNNASIAASAMSEAGSEMAEATSELVDKTKKNIDHLLNELEEKKKIGEQISNRTTNSINEFENPNITQMTQSKGGTHKTRRKFLKHKSKSKRVRFDV
jgi:hypothetical protein